MQCKSCGAINEENSKFCKKCGTQLENVANSNSNLKSITVKEHNKPVNKKIGKAVKVVAIVAVIFLAIFGCMSLIGENKKFNTVENTICLYLGENDETYFINGKEKEVIGSVAHSENCSMSLTVDVSLDGMTRVSMFDGHRLMLIKETGISEISQDVYGYVLSVEGNKVAYAESKGELFLYDCESMISEKIANIVDEDSIKISPNGKCVAYVDQEEESKLCFYYNDKVYEIGKDLLPIGLPDSGEYVYCYNTQNEGIYVKYLNGESKKLAANSGSRFYFNNDHTQLQFSADDSWYVSDGGSDKIKLFDNCERANVFSPLLTDSIHDVTEVWNDDKLGIYVYIAVYTEDISNLKDSFYIKDRTLGDSVVDCDLYYVNEKWESELIEENILDDERFFCVGVDKTGKDLAYIKNNKLYKIEDGKYKNPYWVADNVKKFAMTSDGEAFYYLDEEGNLWYKKGRKEEKKIAEDVHKRELYITHDDCILFLTDYSNASGTLYSCYQGKEKRRIADDVSMVSINNKFAVYKTNYDYDVGTFDLYGTNKGDDFSLILENIY